VEPSAGEHPARTQRHPERVSSSRRWAGALHGSISPVNSFRLVFNEYLGTTLPLLPDRTVRHASDDYPFPYSDISRIVARW